MGRWELTMQPTRVEGKVQGSECFFLDLIWAVWERAMLKTFDILQRGLPKGVMTSSRGWTTKFPGAASQREMHYIC